MPEKQIELTLRGLRVFVALEETGSIAGAADRLGSSPSGVSQHITGLERAVGTKLFDRRKRPVALTPAGQALQHHAHRILRNVADAEAELADLHLSSFPKLTLAVIDDLDETLMPELVLELRKRFDNCFVKTMTGRSDHMTKALIDRDADIALSTMVPDDPDRFRSFPILREQFILATTKGLLEPKQPVDISALSRLPFVHFSHDMPIGRLIAQHLQRVGFQADHRYAFDTSGSIFAMMCAEQGWTLTTPLNLLDAERYLTKLDFHPMPFPSLSRIVHLIARTDELGLIPEQLAQHCRRLFAAELMQRFKKIAPGFTDAMMIQAE